MIETLAALDGDILLLINRTLSNPVTDFVWPIITDYIDFWPVRIVLLCVWLWLIIRGGSAGRSAALLLVPVIVAADQLSSSLIKEWVARPRPCHTVDGASVVQGIHMLVECGPGKSFPSSHAVNNFAAATTFSLYYPRWKWAFLSWASLVALSRPAVGVHYPSDIIGGAVLGALVSIVVVRSWSACAPFARDLLARRSRGRSAP